MSFLISPNFAIKSIIFSNYGQGPFPKITGKSPALIRLYRLQMHRLFESLLLAHANLYCTCWIQALIIMSEVWEYYVNPGRPLDKSV